MFGSFIIKLNSFFSRNDNVCFDFLPRHHNIIRYRRGLFVVKDDFNTVCSSELFPNREELKYDLFLGECDRLFLCVQMKYTLIRLMSFLNEF